MTRHLLLLGICLTLLAGHVGVEADEALDTRWIQDYEQGRKMAEKAGKPLFVVFHCEH
jgi:hypothetical protein